MWKRAEQGFLDASCRALAYTFQLLDLVADLVTTTLKSGICVIRIASMAWLSKQLLACLVDWLG
jgi:hypothetical protein